MSDHKVVVQLYYDGDWHDAPALTRGGITLSRGAAGEGQDAPPSAAGLKLDDRTGDYNPRNVTGSLYGLVGRNTPMRVQADGSVRSATEIASWAPGREIKGSAWTTVQGGGILRRLQQGTTPLRTPAVRAVPSASNLIAFWPLEEGEDATRAASGLDGGDPLTLSGAIGFGRGAGLPGWPPIVDLGQGGGTLTAPIRGASSTAFGIEYVVRYPTRDSGLAVSPTLMDIKFSGGTIARLTLFADPYMYALPVDEADLGLGAAARPEVPVYDSVYRHFQLDVEQDGSDVVLTWYINGEFISTGSFPGQETYTGQTMGTPDEVRINPAGNTVGMPALGYLGFYSSASPAWSDGIPHLGYPGELAGQRFLRVADEEGIDADVIGDPDDTQAMGPQPAVSLVDVLRECVRTDDGLLFEARDDRTLIMRTGRDRYNQDAALTLDFAGEQLAPGLAPVIDDGPTRNDVTATRRGGGSARAVQLTGPLNVQDPIADPQGIGRVDHRVDVNTATDDVLPSHASWHLAKGTVDEPRYPNITVDLDGRGVGPALIAALDALEIGDRFEVENLPADWQPGNASLLLLGVRENYPPGAGDFRRLVTLNAAPASVFEIALVGANDGSTDLRGAAVDADVSTLTSAVGAYATSLSVTSTGGVVWTTDADDWNPALNGGGLYIEIGGEQMRVTGITGASSPQTVDVVRSTNGVVKAHAAGAAVAVAHPIRVGL